MKTALITGASSGMGLEFAKILAREGYYLVLVARRENLLENLRTNLLSKHKIKVTIICLDLSVRENSEKLYKTVIEKGIKVDLLINNAGFGDFGEFVETNYKKNQDMIQLNIMTLTDLTRLFLVDMVKNNEGGIINLASIVSFQPGPLMAVYYASKAYVLSFTEGIATELKDTGIKVTALCPGPTDSGFADGAGLEKSVLFKRFKPVPAVNVAEFGYKSWKKGKVVAIHGIHHKALVFGERFLSRRMTSRLMKWMQEKA